MVKAGFDLERGETEKNEHIPIDKLKSYLKEKQASAMVNIIHMSFYHGLESAMNAGRDIAIGDFVYEFDNVYADFPTELLTEVYEKLLEGNDIVKLERYKD